MRKDSVKNERFKTGLWKTADAFGLNILFDRLVRRDGWLILCGHGICHDQPAVVSHDDRHLPLGAFRQQMEYLLDRGYRFVTLSEGLERKERGLSLRKLVTLTFDDGLKTVVDLVYPVMQELGLKGCIYVVTDSVGSPRLLWTDMVTLVCWFRKRFGSLSLDFPGENRTFPLGDQEEVLTATQQIIARLRSIPDTQRRRTFEEIEKEFDRIPADFIPAEYHQVSWEQLRELDPGTLEVGNHTVSHPKLTMVDEATLKREVTESKRRIEGEIGRPADHFCYPGSALNSDVRESVRWAGHRTATTSYHGVNVPATPAFELRRVLFDMTLTRFKARLSGLEQFVNGIRKPAGKFRVAATQMLRNGALQLVFTSLSMLTELLDFTGLFNSLF